MDFVNKNVLVIAEAGVNHNGSMELALELIQAAAAAGADVVKFQSFKADQLTTAAAPKAVYQQQNDPSKTSQQDMLRKLELSEQDHLRLFEYCERLDIEFMSTPFDEASLDFLVSRNLIRRLKIPSGEITSLPFILRASRSGLPLIISTGMATLSEIETALMCIAFGIKHASGDPDREAMLAAYSDIAVQKALIERVIVLHCTTEYPAPLHEVNLNAIRTLQQSFQTPVGYSDHTQGIAVPLAAVALGACLIEKHFTLDRNMEGPDHKASLIPTELKAMVQGIRDVQASLGSSRKLPSPSELANRAAARKSLVASCYISEGAIFTRENLTCKRPGTGIPAAEFWNVLGSTATRSYQPDELIDSQGL
jgi:N-acetylneuraminate synthase